MSYNAKVPPTQFGAVSKRGSDFANHAVLTALEVARRWAWCISVLSVDLTKAFDKVLREIELGIPTNMTGSLTDHLTRRGLSNRQARWVALLGSPQGYCCFHLRAPFRNVFLIWRSPHSDCPKERGSSIKDTSMDPAFSTQCMLLASHFFTLQ